ncbi:hypothetical protein H8K47_17140 [Undibacterium sp. CY7W]|uniref:Uncharacterized protein n=1 Tax=Undibacterium rugosum TaxID=2762291 RepID=A0A923KUG4_9BURK|nr:hypothetical protein [Undibacterium rugosum]MBC3937084.1 hypothetical protein [Undibacterium rugosum]
MSHTKKKHPVISAISGIQTIKDVADAAGIVLDKNLSPISLSLWVNLTGGLYESMDGEAMGIMFALIIDIAHKGFTVTDIKTIQINQAGNNFNLKFFFKDDSDCTATFH